MGVVQLEAFYLPPHIGTIALVEVKQRHQLLILTSGYVGINKVASEVSPSVVVQVHG